MQVGPEILESIKERTASFMEERENAQGAGFGFGLAVGTSVIYGLENASDHASVTPPRQEILDVHGNYTGQHSGQTDPGSEATHQLVEGATLAGAVALGVVAATALRAQWLQRKDRPRREDFSPTA